jgi:hypothetical protein
MGQDLTTKLFNTLILCSFLCGCRSQKDVIGTFEWRGNRTSPDNQIVEFENDSLFTYTYWSDILGQEQVSGKWFLKKDTLYLRREQEQASQKLLLLQERMNDSLSKERLQVVEKYDREALTGAEVYLNNEQKPYKIDPTGIIFSNNGSISQIKVKYLSWEDSIQVKDKNANDFLLLVNIQGQRMNYSYLSSKWIVKKRKLIPVDENGKLLINSIFVKK